jgi:hypothetical protein
MPSRCGPGHLWLYPIIKPLRRVIIITIIMIDHLSSPALPLLPPSAAAGATEIHISPSVCARQDIPGTDAQMAVEARCRTMMEQCAGARLDGPASDALWQLDRARMEEVSAEAAKASDGGIEGGGGGGGGG